MLASLSLPFSVWFGLIATPLIVAIGQVLFKMAAARFETADLAGFMRLSFDPVFLAAVVLYAAATFLWVFTLRSVPLHLAHVFMALTFVLVPIFSYLFLGEAISLRFLLGLGLILAGLLVVST